MVERWAQEAKEPTQTLATAEGRADEFPLQRGNQPSPLVSLLSQQTPGLRLIMFYCVKLGREDGRQPTGQAARVNPDKMSAYKV